MLKGCIVYRILLGILKVRVYVLNLGVEIFKWNWVKVFVLICEIIIVGVEFGGFYLWELLWLWFVVLVYGCR